MLKTLALATSLAMFGSPALAVYKCTDQGGRLTFQDAPCAGSGQKIDARPALAPAERTPPVDAAAAIAKLQLEADIATAVRMHRPTVGMTTSQLRDAMGSPSSINENNVEGVRRDQWVYDRSNGTWYVYPVNGVVRSVQHQSALSSGTSIAAASNRACPSEHEIRNAETSASSITLSVAEKVERQRQIRDMRNCGR
ncbi:MAG: DUF4124 domain-containing protein [Burkholderiales bacterium]